MNNIFCSLIITFFNKLTNHQNNTALLKSNTCCKNTAVVKIINSSNSSSDKQKQTHIRLDEQKNRQEQTAKQRKNIYEYIYVYTSSQVAPQRKKKKTKVAEESQQDSQSSGKISPKAPSKVEASEVCRILKKTFLKKHSDNFTTYTQDSIFDGYSYNVQFLVCLLLLVVHFYQVVVHSVLSNA